MNGAESVIHIAKEERGYLEKASDRDLDSKTANAGKNNFTKYARDLYPALQGQPWCDMFVDWCFVKALGEIGTRKLLGGFSAYTPTSAKHFKDKGLWKQSPQPGDQIFFKNTARIYHTGIVERVASDRVYTIEGNTSSTAEVVANGGGVWAKSYPLSHQAIAGYGRPDWSLVETPQYSQGWNRDANGWWYADTNHSYVTSAWKIINGNWQEIDGKWYYFEPRAGHPQECALYTTDSDGVQNVGVF